MTKYRLVKRRNEGAALPFYEVQRKSWWGWSLLGWSTDYDTALDEFIAHINGDRDEEFKVLRECET